MTLYLIQEISTNHITMIFSTNQVSELNLSQNYLPIENELHNTDVQLKQIVSLLASYKAILGTDCLS